MTDRELGAALTEATAWEVKARAHWQAAETVAEQQAALSVVRLATPVIRSLEQWITARALRGAK